MKVKGKLVIISIIGVILLIVFTSTIFYIVTSRYVNKEELRDSNNTFDEIKSVLDRDEDNMKITSTDWAYWDETYHFIEGKYNTYTTYNNNDDAIKQLKMNLILITNSNGNVISNKSNGITEKESYLLLKKILNKSYNLKVYKTNINPSAGVLFVSGKLYMISVCPVTTTDKKAKINGTFIMVRYLDHSFAKYINKLTNSKIEFSENTNLKAKALSGVIDRTYTNLTAYKGFVDFNGNNSIITSITNEREDYKNLCNNFKLFNTIFIVLTILIITGKLFVIDKLLLCRLMNIYKFTESIAKTRDTASRMEIWGSDEISETGNAINKMLAELDSAYKEILFLSYSDKLTGLRNRAYMEKKFEEFDKNLEMNYAIIMANINGLKLVNDTFGHKKGDEVICIIRDILKKVCQKDDIISRWGGDDFVVVVLNKQRTYLVDLINKIKNECIKFDGLDLMVSLSLGSAERDKTLESEAVMNLAEERMYRNKLTENKSSRNATVKSLERTLYEKHNETEEHTLRVKQLSIQVGKKLRMPEEKIDELELLSVLHDIGKIGIPEQILTKAGKLTEEERKIMRSHSEIGYRIAVSTLELSHVANEILAHHEKFDGTGYPNGLKGDEIPLLSRIINIVDSFDVMTNSRAYKDAFSIEYAVEELKRCSGKQFDPELVKIFLDILDEKHEKD